MKTIAITSFHTLISRNLFATGLLDRLKKRGDLRVVLVVPDFKVGYFEERFGDGNVSVYGVEQYKPSKYFFGLLFKRISVLANSSGSARMKKEYKYYWDHKRLYYTFSLFMGFLGRSFILRRILRFLDLRLSPRNLFADLFDRYKPDLIFSTDIQNENDVSLAQDARRRGVKIVGMIRSWDNTTERILRIFPDTLLVGSQALYDEIWAYYRYPREKTIITGNPHYEGYKNPPKHSREEFFKSFGLDPAKKLILYAPAGSLLMKTNDLDQYVMETLGAQDAQILVRFPLGGDVPLINFKQPANMVFDKPGARFGAGKELELRPEDDERLIEELVYSDLIVTGPTSILLDAAFFDKPIIGSDIYPDVRHKFQKCWGFLSAHILNLEGTAAFHHSTTKEDFLSAVAAYLKDPQLDAGARARARAKWFSHIDGGSVDRLEQALLSQL